MRSAGQSPATRRVRRGRRAFRSGMLYGLFPIVLAGCSRDGAQVPPALGVRPVRVLLFEAAGGCRIRVDGPYTLRRDDDAVLAEGASLPWTPVVARDGLAIGDLAPAGGPVTLEAEHPGTIFLAARRDETYLPTRQYAGRVTLSITGEGAVRCLNAVDVEAYVAGAVLGEAPSSFHDAALQAQAVAARTYVMYLMSERADKGFDVRCTESDQVYQGIGHGGFARRAARAVEATRGLVLAWEAPPGPRAFCTYYSAACGGVSQSIADVQPGDAPAPLRGGVRCDYCKIAGRDVYRWGPAEIAKRDLLARLKERDARFASWAALAAGEVSRRTETGKIAEVTLASDGGERVTLSGERFRLAVGSRVMRSTDCDLVDRGDDLRFENGRGFGHGVGLCQWGMEGQARQGRNAAEILHYYYPGALILRAY